MAGRNSLEVNSILESLLENENTLRLSLMRCVPVLCFYLSVEGGRRQGKVERGRGGERRERAHGMGGGCWEAFSPPG